LKSFKLGYKQQNDFEIENLVKTTSNILSSILAISPSSLDLNLIVDIAYNMLGNPSFDAFLDQEVRIWILADQS
jgi:hypothetical protein